AISARSLSLLASSSPWRPQYRALYTPGAPPRASTQRPESSATVGRPLALQRASALIFAFSAKVVPVSSGSRSRASSFWLRTWWPCASRIRRSSLSLPGLPVAAQIFMVQLLLLLPGQKFLGKAGGIEGDQIVDPLAHPDKPDRQAQTLLDRHHAAALGA